MRATSPVNPADHMVRGATVDPVGFARALIHIRCIRRNALFRKIFLRLAALPDELTGLPPPNNKS
jgi:hypothetical protein